MTACGTTNTFARPIRLTSYREWGTGIGSPAIADGPTHEGLAILAGCTNEVLGRTIQTASNRVPTVQTTVDWVTVMTAIPTLPGTCLAYARISGTGSIQGCNPEGALGMTTQGQKRRETSQHNLTGSMPGGHDEQSHLRQLVPLLCTIGIDKSHFGFCYATSTSHTVDTGELI